MLVWLRNSALTIAHFGVIPSDSPEIRSLKAILMVAATITATTFITVMGPLYVLFDEAQAGSIYLGFGVFILINLLFYGLVHRRYDVCVMIIAICALPAHWLTTILLGGFSKSHGLILWGLFFPVLGSLVFFNARHAIFWFIIFMGGTMTTIFLEPSLRPENNIPVFLGNALLSINIMTSSLLTLGMMIYFVAQRDEAYRLLRVEQAKAEHLLNNILPAEIALRLKEQEQIIADHFDGATILFADVVNFTPMSATMTPVELVELLNEVFSYFDSLVEKYGVEKIKTIGDCYMVASGVPTPHPHHAKTLVQMALEMRDYVTHHAFQGRHLAFRLGINSGPVVAGVIGRKKFIYDLWGDAVNTASRMESQGKGNVIQITQATYELIKSDFVCEAQGSINVKGKGEMIIWHVVKAK